MNIEIDFINDEKIDQNSNIFSIIRKLGLSFNDERDDMCGVSCDIIYVCLPKFFFKNIMKLCGAWC